MLLGVLHNSLFKISHSHKIEMGTIIPFWGEGNGDIVGELELGLHKFKVHMLNHCVP